MKRMFNTVFAVITAAVLLAALPATAQECYTPLEWIPKNYVSNLDRNKNFVDDAIEQMDADEVITVLVCLNSCVQGEELERLSQFGEIEYRSPYLSVIVMNNVVVSDAIALGEHERVAMVELSREIEPYLDVSMAAARIRSSGVYAGANIEDAHPTIDGTGVTIAIIDSGVDNEPGGGGTGHESFPSWKYVAGYDAITDVETDPDDLMGHGTHVAGIALGTGGGTGTYRGAAPGANLVDIQIFATGGASDAVVLRSFDKVIQRRVAWGIDVVNMSFGKAINSDGTDVISQAANRIVREGVMVVAAAGNSGANVIGPPGSADFVLTVANAYDQGTILRTDDAIWWSSSSGPRLNDGDGMTSDELKPDVTGYGAIIKSAQHNTVSGYVDNTGTSMASPQVAGLAALILHANPGMDPLSVKDLIQNTAEDFGTAGWDVNFGHGIINGYAAVDEVVSSLQTDVYFSDYCYEPGNPTWWKSGDVHPQNPSVVEGTPNNVVVTINNAGPATAYNVKVRVGIYNFSNSTADFDICEHVIATLPPGPYTFSCPWTPEADGLTPSVVHACLKAYIIYPNDTDPSNNCAQHNVNIQQTHSPALFHMTVVNPTGEEAQMEIATNPSADEIAAQGWELTMSEQNFTMGATDCPKTVTIALEAVGANPVDELPVTIHVRSRRGQEVQELGGVEIIGVNGNGTPRPPDKTVFAGIRHTSLGQARLHSTPAQLTVSEIGADGADGVEVQLGKADFWRGTLAEFNVADLPDGSSVSFTPKGTVGGNTSTTVSEMALTDNGDHAQLSVDFQVDDNTLTVEVYENGELVGADINEDGVVANIWPLLDNIQVTPFRVNEDGVVYAEVQLAAVTDIEILGTSTSTMTAGDRIVVRCGTQPSLPEHISTVDVLAVGPTSFALTGEAGGTFERPFRALGNPALEWDGDGTILTASRVTARSAVGARAEVPSLQSYDMWWEAVDITDVPLSSYVNVTARGNLDNVGPADLGFVSVHRMPDVETVEAEITADMSKVGAQSYTVEVYSGGTVVYSVGGFDADIGTVQSWPNGGGQAVDENTNGPCFKLFWPEEIVFQLTDGSAVYGDELRVIAEDADHTMLSVAEVGAYVIGLDELRIIDEVASAALPVSVGEPTRDMPFRLYQNYPNPFAEQTMFRFDLLTSAEVDLEIYNLRGEHVATVLSRQLSRGTHEVEWKRDEGTTSIPSGAYIYRLKVRPLNSAQSFEVQRQMVILR